jgi:hypothetical protein
MKNKPNEQKIPAKAEETPAENKDTRLDIEEIDLDEACDVVGGSCAACGSVCSSTPPAPPALNQL